MSIEKRVEEGVEITTYSGADLEQFKAGLEAQLYGQTPAGCCVRCKQPFSSNNVFSAAGWGETKISKLCEVCWDIVMGEEEE